MSLLEIAKEEDEAHAAEADIGEGEDAFAELAQRDAAVLVERGVRVAVHEVGRLVEPEVEVALPDRLPVLLGEEARCRLGREGLLKAVRTS